MHRRFMLLSAASLGVAVRGFANAAGPRVEPEITAAHKVDITKPVSKRGSESKYDFSGLTEVGMAIGVKNKTAKQLAGVVSAANRKGKVEVKDGAGNTVYHTKPAIGEGGAKIELPDTSKPKTTVTREFFAVDVDAARAKTIKGTPLEGSKALIIRSI